jgi:hypothetical protein
MQQMFWLHLLRNLQSHEPFVQSKNKYIVVHVVIEGSGCSGVLVVRSKFHYPYNEAYDSTNLNPI